MTLVSSPVLGLSAALSELAQEVSRSVVVVRGGPGSSGSGVIWDRPGLVITNHHVVPGPTAQVLLPDGHRYAARVASRAPELDLVALEFSPDAAGLAVASLAESPAPGPVRLADSTELAPARSADATALTPTRPADATAPTPASAGDASGLARAGDDATAPTLARVGDSTALRVGDLVLAVGNPMAERNAATLGMVCAPASDLLRVAINLRPGNSGGALANARGEIVGIPNMVVGRGLAVAVSSQTVRRFLNGLEQPVAWL
jgi:S1-C subfamily serine protease